LRVVQLLPELNEGGVERGVIEINREFLKMGIDSFVISNGGKLVDKLKGATHIKFDVSSKNPFTAFKRVLKLKKILQKINPDIIHVRSRVPAWLAYFANKDLNIPFITTVHGFYSVNRYSKIMTKGDRVICVSNSIKRYVLDNYDVDEKKLRVIYRGINLEEFNPSNVDKGFIEEFKKKFSLNDKFIVSTIGRITPLKDFETFILAINEIKTKKPNVVGIIVGGVREDKMDYFYKLKKLVKKLSLENNIKFVGSIKKIASIYYLSDVVVSASKKPESFGRSVAEAMAMNRPVIATNHGGVVEIINDKDRLFKVGDYKELAHKILCIKEGNFREYIKNNFSLEKMAKETVKVYKEVL